MLYLTTHLEAVAVPETLLSQGDCEQHAVMDGCTPTPEDDWKAEKDRLQTQMGFDTDSELVPCHLIDGGKREIEEGGEGEGERGRGEKAWGVSEVNILVS